MKTIVDYARKVKEQHALNKNLAPVEADASASSKAYAIGQHFILNGELYKAKTAIALGDALVLDTNYEAAGSIEAQIETLDAENEALTNKLNNEIVTRSAMGAKNMLPFDLATIKANNTTGTWNNNVYTLNGVDFTFNADGSVLVDGTASGNAEVDYLLNLSISGNFILSDAVAGVASNYWAFAKVDGDSSNLLILTSDEIPASISSTMDYFRIKVFSGKTASNVLFKPMLRLASDTDPTYQPYAKTNQELTAENQTLTNKLADEVETRAKLGAHQFLNYNLATLKTLNTTGTWSDNVYTLTDGTNTITVTVNNDLSITVNGTPPVNSALQFNLMDKAGAIPIGSYGLNGCPSGGTYGTYGLYANSSGSTINTDYGNGGSIDYAVSTNALKVFIIIRANVTVNNLLFKPLIRLASDPSTELAPYAMTNRELTEHITKADLYARKGGHEEVSVSVTTSDTMGSKIAELCAAILTKIQSLESDEYAEVSHIQGQNLNQQTPLSINQYKSNATSFAADFTRVTPASDGSYFVLEQTQMRASSANVKMTNSVFYVNGTNTVTARENTNFAANGTIKAIIQIYKKI